MPWTSLRKSLTASCATLILFVLTAPAMAEPLMSLRQIDHSIQEVNQQISRVSTRIGALVADIATIVDETEEQERLRLGLLAEVKAIDMELQNMRNRLREGQTLLEELDREISMMEASMSERRNSLERSSRLLYRDIHIPHDDTRYLQSVFMEIGTFLEALYRDLRQLQVARNDNHKKVLEHQSMIQRFSSRSHGLLEEIDAITRKVQSSFALTQEKKRILDHLHEEQQDLQEIFRNLLNRKADFYETVKDIQHFKGYIPLPADGPYFVSQDDNSLLIDMKNDARVYCIFDGEVVYRGNLYRFENVIIIDHGNNYYSVYGGLVDVIVNEGDRVYANELLGSSLYLYFELRHRSTPLDPQEWIFLEEM